MTATLTQQREERATQVRLAVIDEMLRFNVALKERDEPLFIDSPASLNHRHKVELIRSDFTLVTRSPGPAGCTHSWAYANDHRWARLLAQAGVERHPLFAEYTHKS